MGQVFEYRHRVIAEEIDEQDHASNVSYVRWMQDAALAHISSLGWTLERHRQRGLAWVVRRHEIHYVRSALLDDELAIRTWISTCTKAASERRYSIHRASDDTLLARASTDWVLMDTLRGRPCRIPDDLLEAIEQVLLRDNP